MHKTLYVPHATLALGSCFRWASKTASLTWSQILSAKIPQKEIVIRFSQQIGIGWERLAAKISPNDWKGHKMQTAQITPADFSNNLKTGLTNVVISGLMSQRQAETGKDNKTDELRFLELTRGTSCCSWSLGKQTVPFRQVCGLKVCSGLLFQVH